MSVNGHSRTQRLPPAGCKQSFDCCREAAGESNPAQVSLPMLVRGNRTRCNDLPRAPRRGSHNLAGLCECSTGGMVARGPDRHHLSQARSIVGERRPQGRGRHTSRCDSHGEGKVPALVTCPACGRETSGLQLFCSHCGASVGGTSGWSRSPALVIGLVLVFVVIAAIVSSMITGRFSGPSPAKEAPHAVRE